VGFGEGLAAFAFYLAFGFEQIEAFDVAAEGVGGDPVAGEVFPRIDFAAAAALDEGIPDGCI